MMMTSAPFATHYSLRTSSLGQVKNKAIGVADVATRNRWVFLLDRAAGGKQLTLCRFHVWHVLKDWNVGQSTGEITPALEAIDRARRSVEANLERQAAAFQAEFVVGSDVQIRVQEVPCGYEGCKLNDLDVDVSWFGTAVRREPGFKPPEHPKAPALILSMMPLGRRKSAELEEEEDEIAERAKEAEEKALEAEDEPKEESE